MGEVGRDEHGARGWWGLACWNGLSPEQQRKLIDDGNLEIGYTPAGWCTNGAEVCVETQNDRAPGPRFYCRTCAVEYLAAEGVVTQTESTIVDRWSDDSLQFPRLIAELLQTEAITHEIFDELCVSMDLEASDLVDLFERAQVKWDKIKATV